MGSELSVLQAKSSAAVSEPPTTLRAGNLPTIRPVTGRFGPYDLVCQLASGGMGTVYVASRTHEEGVRRTVALKTIHPHLAVDRRFVRMFLAEARIVSRISHPYVCRLSDMGRETMSPGPGADTQPVPYVAMEYLVGEPLSRMLPLLSSNRSEFSTACVVRMVAQLCEGLHAAHEVTDEDGKFLHVVHRDISPDNLFLLYDGTVRVVDFGIARADDNVRTTHAGGPKGKFAYMSPEQLQCEKIDRRSDIWSMGVVLWELLTAVPLIPRGSDMHASHAILGMPILPPSSRNPHVPAVLDQITLRALDRDPNKRFDTAIDLAHELDQFLARYYGPISAATLGNWLEAMFPGCRSYRQRIVPNARKLLEESGSLQLSGPIASQRTLAQGVARSRGEKPARRPVDSVLRKITTRASAVPLWAYTVCLTVLILAVWMESRGYISSGEVSARAAEGGTVATARAGEAETGPTPRAPGAAEVSPLTIGALSVTPLSAPEAQTPESEDLAGIDERTYPKSTTRGAVPAKVTRPARIASGKDTASSTPEVSLPGAMGQVYVSTPGSSVSIELNGKILGATPSRLQLPVGSHVLHLRRKNAAPLPVEVKVAAGKVVFIEVPLGS